MLTSGKTGQDRGPPLPNRSRRATVFVRLVSIRRRADFIVDTSRGFDSAPAQVRAILNAAVAIRTSLTWKGASDPGRSLTPRFPCPVNPVRLRRLVSFVIPLTKVNVASK